MVESQPSNNPAPDLSLFRGTFVGRQQELAGLKSALMAWRKETTDPLLNDSYLQELMQHTDDHLVRIAQEKEKALAKGTEAPYNRIDMTSFQEDWPTSWMR